MSEIPDTGARGPDALENILLYALKVISSYSYFMTIGKPDKNFIHVFINLFCKMYIDQIGAVYTDKYCRIEYQFHVSYTLGAK